MDFGAYADGSSLDAGSLMNAYHQLKTHSSGSKGRISHCAMLIPSLSYEFSSGNITS